MALPSPPRPILLMARALGVGGTERQLTETAMTLDRRRFFPWVGCFDSRGVRGDDLRRGRVPIVEFPVRSFGTPRTLALAWQFVRWVRAHRIALVHPFDYPTVLFGVPLARTARVPVVLSSQRGDRALFPPAYRRALRLTDRLADGIVVNSDYIRRLLATHEGVPDDRMHTCRNGLDTSVFRPDGPARRPEHLQGCVVGIVTALRPEKSIETLLTAFARVRDERHHLVIVGDGPCKPALDRTARDLAIAGRVSFVPTTSDVANWYRGIDVFVLPTLNESFSNSLMEAMACGCCVVASKVGGNVELVRDGENGLMFEAGNAAALHQRLEILLDDPALRRTLAAEARRTIDLAYTKEAAAGRLAALYETLLEAPAAG
jgi:glycosyltransferase involved in cell wall biosynthesis